MATCKSISLEDWLSKYQSVEFSSEFREIFTTSNFNSITKFVDNAFGKPIQSKYTEKYWYLDINGVLAQALMVDSKSGYYIKIWFAKNMSPEQRKFANEQIDDIVSRELSYQEIIMSLKEDAIELAKSLREQSDKRYDKTIEV